MTERCTECGRRATWMRHTQFAAQHPYCTEHAEEQSDFGKGGSSYFFWREIPKHEGWLARVLRGIFGKTDEKQFTKGTFSPEARGDADAFFAHKKEHPDPVPYEELTPL